MKKFGQVVLILLIGAAAGFFFGKKKSAPDPANWVSVAEHNAAIAAADLQHKADLVTINAAKEVIGEQNEKIADLLAAAATPSPAEAAKDREIAELSAKVKALEAQGDLAGALAAAKTEISAWAEKFNLADGKHQDSLTALNKAWQVKFDAQVVISDAGWAAYDREHALLLGCEDLSADLQKQAPAGAFERAAHDIQGLATGIYAAARYKDPLPLAVYAGEKLAVKIWRLIHK